MPSFDPCQDQPAHSGNDKNERPKDHARGHSLFWGQGLQEGPCPKGIPQRGGAARMNLASNHPRFCSSWAFRFAVLSSMTSSCVESIRLISFKLLPNREMIPSGKKAKVRITITP